MSAIITDTLKYAMELQATHANRQKRRRKSLNPMLKRKMRLFKETHDAREKELASKGNVREAELRLQKEIEQVRSEIKNAELRLLRWQIGGWIGLVAIMPKGFGRIGF